MPLQVLVLALAASPIAATAATYYVDFAAGSNTNSGASANHAWKHCPGDPNATAAPKGTALAPGDVILFKGGVSYVGTIEINWSGTSENPITYDGTRWNGLRPIITANNTPSTTGFTVKGSVRQHFTIRGFALRDFGGYDELDPIWGTTTPITSPPGGTGISLSGGSSHVLIADCEFAEIGQWRNVQPMSGTGSVTGTGISLEDNSSIRIENCDFTRMKTGISIKATSVTSDITVRNSSFHNYMNWLIDVAPRKADAILRNITIDGCRFYDYKEFDNPNWKGFGEKPHQDGIFLRTASMASTWENVVVKNCTFSSDQSSDGGTASIYLSQGASADIHNNLFLNDVHSNAYVNVGYNKAAGMVQRVRIWNNTFVGSTRAIKVTPGNSNPDYVEIKNNVLYRTVAFEPLNISPTDTTTLVIDNNLYFAPNSARAMHDGSSYRTLSDWQKLSGKDQYSIWQDPGFTSISGPSSSWDLTLTATSPLLGKTMGGGVIIPTSTAPHNVRVSIE